MANWVFAQTTHVDAAQRYVVLHTGKPLGGRYKFQVRQNRLNGFRDVGGRNLPFPIPKASGLYDSLYYRTSRDRITEKVVGECSWNFRENYAFR